MKERKLHKINGFTALFVLIFGTVGLTWLSYITLGIESGAFFVIITILSFAVSIACTGFFIINPNEARVVTFFGKYIGTATDPGFYFTTVLTLKGRVSLKVVNINTETMKVNDAKGNPIEIAAVVVYRVVDAYKAYFGVDDYREFVMTQSDAAVRALASEYPYDGNDETMSLRGSPEEVAGDLRNTLQERLETAGVNVIEARLSHLAYAPEIAQSMLKRQQAEAVIAARKYIVENAVEMVEDVLSHFEKDKSFGMEDSDKINLMNNLLVALVSEQDAQPVINTGGR